MGRKNKVLTKKECSKSQFRQIQFFFPSHALLVVLPARTTDATSKTKIISAK